MSRGFPLIWECPTPIFLSWHGSLKSFNIAACPGHSNSFNKASSWPCQVILTLLHKKQRYILPQDQGSGRTRGLERQQPLPAEKNKTRQNFHGIA